MTDPIILSFFASRYNILIADPKQILPAEMLEFFDKFPLFKNHLAKNCEDAERIANTVPRWHACIMAVKGRDSEVCSFLKKNAAHLPVFIAMDEISLEAMRECEKLGTQQIFQISPLNWVKTIEAICDFAVLNAFNPLQNTPICPEKLKLAAQNLVEKPPMNVSDWASNCGMTGRNMQYLWSNTAQFKAKDAFLLGRLAIGAMCLQLGISLGTNRRERIPNGKFLKRLLKNYQKKQGYYEKIFFGKLWSWIDKNTAALIISFSLQFLSEIMENMPNCCA